MINNIGELFNCILDSLKIHKLELQKLENENQYDYYIDKVIVNNILRIIFENCSANEYCFSINRENYGQIKVNIFEKNSSSIVSFNFFTEVTNNLDSVLEKKYKKNIDNLQKRKIIPVIGPDGVGKSTLLEEVIELLDEKVFFKRFKKVVRHSIIYNIFHPMNKNNVRKIVGKISIKNQHDDIHYLLCILGALSAYPYLIFQTLLKKRTVLLDRFFYDYFLENISFMNKTTILRKNWKSLIKMIPRTYALIHLDANSEIVLSRKQELSADDIDKYRTLNFTLYLEKPSVVYLYVNTALRLEQCKDIIFNTCIDAEMFPISVNVVK